MLCENIDIMIAESAKKAWSQGFEQGFEQGFKQSFEQGFKQGLEQSDKEVHTSVFKAAVIGGFGNIPGHIEAQIDTASFDQLVEWTKQLSVASSLDEVFGAN